MNQFVRIMQNATWQTNRMKFTTVRKDFVNMDI